MHYFTRLIVLGSILASGACEQPDGDVPVANSPANTVSDTPLLEISRVTGLAIVDVSVPFEKLKEAPMLLRQIADALNSESTGLFVMHYYDDSLQHTSHIFVIGESGSTYIEITSRMGEKTNRTEIGINGATYDERTDTLILQTSNGEFSLTPADVTPMGA